MVELVPPQHRPEIEEAMQPVMDEIKRFVDGHLANGTHPDVLINAMAAFLGHWLAHLSGDVTMLDHNVEGLQSILRHNADSSFMDKIAGKGGKH